MKKTNITKKFYEFNKKFTALDISSIKGKKLKSWDSISKNYYYLHLILRHYKIIFDKKKFTKAHGDLTLDNVIFNAKKISIIDWEFFGAKPKLWGYDIAIYSSHLIFTFIIKKKFQNMNYICSKVVSIKKIELARNFK